METTLAIYFYGANRKYGYMSNFYKAEFEESGVKFNCSEQYFMYKKCLEFEPHNTQLQQQILDETSPRKIKSLGRKVKNYEELVWNKKCIGYMQDALDLKFTQNKHLLDKLLSTNNSIIYEASKYDRKWGIGYTEKEAINTSVDKYGRNLLGTCLMAVRTKYQ